jgi:hypothetical protein
MPANGAELVSEAVAEVRRATGLVFIDDGLTLENPDPERAGYDPELYGDRWSPVLISWTDPTEAPSLLGRRLAWGRQLRLETSGPTCFENPRVFT